jgi:hypothetical protein
LVDVVRDDPERVLEAGLALKRLIGEGGTATHDEEEG